MVEASSIGRAEDLTAVGIRFGFYLLSMYMMHLI
jgi:hypothetical protein